MSYKSLKYLMNEKHCIVQIETNKLDQWLSISIDNNTVSKLKFVKSSEELVNDNLIQVISFKDAELRYDKSYGKFVTKTDGFILMNCSLDPIPAEIDKLILKAI